MARKTETVIVRSTPEEKAAWLAYAEANGMSLSELIREVGNDAVAAKRHE